MADIRSRAGTLFSRSARSKVLGGLAVVAAAALLAGCSTTSSSSGGATLTVAETTAPSTLDPQGSSLFADRYAWQLSYQCLLATDASGNAGPELATSYTTSSDGLTYTFTLRKGVKFANGDAFTSKDVVYTFDRLKAGKLGLQTQLFPTLDSVTATSPTVAVFHLKSADAGFASNMANPLVWGCAIMDSKTGDLKSTAQLMNGTGPWKQTTYAANSSIGFARFTDYWGKKAASSALKVLYEPASATQTAGLQAGKIDVAFPDQPGAAALAKNSKITVKKVVSGSTIFMEINNTVKPFNNPLVTQAVALALNRQQLADQAYHGAAVPSAYVPPGVAWGTKVADLPNYTQNITKAKALLTQAGYPNGLSTKLMYITSYDSGTNDLMAAMQTQLALVGIKVTLQPLEVATWVDNLTKRNYALSWNAQSFYSNPYQWIQPNVGQQAPTPASLQALFTAALNAPNQTAYHNAINAIQKEEATTVFPTVTLLATDAFVASKKSLTGVTLTDSGSRDFLADVKEG
jgi:ABC-type transport system substrate-binding protein